MATEVLTQAHHAAHDDHGHGHDHAHHESFIRKYIFSTDHKTIAKQFLLSALIFLFVGGGMALILRWQLAYPGQPLPLIGHLLSDSFVTDGVVQPGFFMQMTTMHASVMIFFVIIPLAVGFFGNLCIPLQIGTDDMAFPMVNMFSFWLVPPAAMCVMSGFFMDGGAAAAGWTHYPPLSVTTSHGHTMWTVGVFLAGFSSILGGLNYIVTVLNKRAPGMGMFDMPLTVWALFITAVLISLGTPVLASDLAILFFDQFFHSSFFIPEGMLYADNVHTGGGQPILFQHLFWFYSHPAVYIMLLPLMGVVSDVMATFSRRPIYGYKAMVFAMAAIGGLGFIVWGHHMFQSGMNPLLGTTFMLSTIVIAVPSAIKTFNWLGTLWRGSIRFSVPMLQALGFLTTFVVGGLSGIFMAAAPADVFIHDTYFIVAHIHYVLFGGSLFGIFAGIYYWFPKLFGRQMNEAWGQIHFFTSFILFNLTFFPMHLLGIGGHMRRISDPTVYEFLAPFQDMNEFITLAAIGLGFAQFILVFNIIYSLKFGRKATRNPWRANSLEWACPSPPVGHGNFDRQIHVYRGPYEFSSPLTKKDYLPQWKKLEEKPAETPVTAQKTEAGESTQA